MNHEETASDLDLYTDFLAGENSDVHEADEKDRKFNELQEKYDDCAKLCESLQTINETLQKKNEILTINLTKLFKTARKEIYLKNKELKRMRERLDNIIFRRATKSDFHTNFSSNRQTNANNDNFSTPNRIVKDDVGKAKIQADKKIDYNKTISPKSTQIITADSRHLLNYYPKIQEKTTSQKPKNKPKSTGDKDDVNVDYGNGINSEKVIDEVTSRENGVSRTSEPVKRKLCSKSSSRKKIPRSETSLSTREGNYDEKIRKLSENKDVEDGEILSDSESKAIRFKRRGNDKEEKDFRRRNVKNVNCKSEYLRQLEVNRMKMQVRREKILLVKAKEDKKYSNFKSETPRGYKDRICR